MATTVPAREEIPVEFTWNATSVYPTRAVWHAEFKRLLASVDEVQQFRGRLGESARTLLEWLDVLQVRLEAIFKLQMYAYMAQSVDSSDQEAVAMSGQASSLIGQFFAAIAFSEPEILAIDRVVLDRWMAEEPGLKLYAHYFDNLFRKQAHVRSAEVEEVLGLASEPLAAINDIFELLVNADLTFQRAVDSKGEPAEVTQSSIDRLLDSPDRELRRTAWENYADAYLAFKNTLATNLLAAVKRDVFLARARRYPSALEAALFENNIPVEVFRNLLDTHRKHLPTWHRYWRVRRAALGVETLHPYDIWAPLTQREHPIPYRQAVEWIAEGMRPLGEAYVEALRRGCLEERWVDVYPNKGKRQGAFSYSVRGAYPFIMMSYTDNLGGLSTLAHELGHSMHGYLTNANQPLLYTDVSLFVAEVASNFNQAMTRAYLMATQDDPDFQIAVIEEAMGNFHRYFFIMPTLARFELELHERVERGEGVTADDMNALMADLFAEGYGGEMAIDRERVGITWAQFSHLYANFYVYQYATGIAAAHALAKPILAGEPGAAERYVAFLSAGSSMYPLDALKMAGVDMTSPEPVETAFDVLAEYVERLARLTGVTVAEGRAVERKKN